MEPFIGQIQAFGFNFAPRGWTNCAGQLLPVANNTALFSLLGTTYGGDGRTTFGIPDLRSTVPVHPGNGPGLKPILWGERGGTTKTRLTTDQMPIHNHAVTKNLQLKIKTSSTGLLINESGQGEAGLATGGNAPTIYSEELTNSESLNGGTVEFTGNIDVLPVGSDTPVSLMQPYIGVNYCIALTGMYPSRN